MKELIPSQLIDKYLNGECTSEEEAQLLTWYDSFEITTDPILSLTEKQKEDLKNKILGRIREVSYLTDAPVEKRRSKTVLRVCYLAAASIAAAVIIVLNFFNPVHNADAGRQAQKQFAATTEVYFTNHSSKLKKYLLPDNSIVWLKPDASINYSRRFVNKFRIISLRGEAFFEVYKDKTHPFLIYSGDIVTKVVGTSFNVRANEHSKVAEVSVVTGKVLVYTRATKAHKSKSVYLFPEQTATYLRSENQLVKLSTQEPSLTIWKKNSLSFDNAPITEVIQTLNKTFDSKIIISDKEISQYTLKADFTDVNLPTIMELLSKSLNITYKMQGETIEVSQKPEN